MIGENRVRKSVAIAGFAKNRGVLADKILESGSLKQAGEEFVDKNVACDRRNRELPTIVISPRVGQIFTVIHEPLLAPNGLNNTADAVFFEGTKGFLDQLSKRDTRPLRRLALL